MRLNPRNRRKALINPVRYLIGRSALGTERTDQELFPLWSHLYEASKGFANGETTRTITIHLAAAFEVATLCKKARLQKVTSEAAEAWMEADTAESGDKITIDARTLRITRAFVRELDNVLPDTPVALWDTARRRAIHRWDVAKANKLQIGTVSYPGLVI